MPRGDGAGETRTLAQIPLPQHRLPVRIATATSEQRSQGIHLSPQGLRVSAQCFLLRSLSRFADRAWSVGPKDVPHVFEDVFTCHKEQAS
jgi:hypothetical protein